MSRRTDHPTRVAPPPRVETLEDVPGGQPNLLPVDALRSALHVAVDPWPNSDPSVTYPESLSLYWNDEVVDRKEWTSPIPDDDYFVEVPVRYLRHGEHELVYEIELYNGVRERSQPLVLTIDEIAPRLDADEGALQIPAQVIEDGLTAFYLEEHDDKLVVEVPQYIEPVVGDRITFFWDRQLNDNDRVDDFDLTHEYMESGEPIRLEFQGEMIRERGDGVRYLHYRIMDRAGNLSARSRTVPLTVAAAPIPRSLPWPALPKATGSAQTVTLNVASLTGDLVAIVSAQATINPGERVQMQWAQVGAVGAETLVDERAPGEFVIPKLSIATHSGKTIPLYYQVITQKNETLDSDHRLVAVNPFSPGLPIPQVVESEMTPGYLLLSEVKVAAHITLDTWQYMSTDCRLRIQVTGISDSGAALYTVIDNHAVTPEEMQIGLGTRNELTVPLSFLNTLKDDSSMQVKAFISFDAGQTWPSTPNLYELTLKIDKGSS